MSANAPLKGQGILNVQYTIDYLIKLGAAPTKIVLGLPFYGRTFVTKLDGNFDDPASEMGFQGVYTKENGFMGYNEICALLSNRTSGWKRSYSVDMSQAVATYRDEAANETRVAVFDSSRSIARKIKFAMSRNLAGAMIWSIDTDDFLGDCDTDGDTFADFKPIPGVTLNMPKRIETNFPLLRTINEGEDSFCIMTLSFMAKWPSLMLIISLLTFNIYLFYFQMKQWWWPWMKSHKRHNCRPEMKTTKFHTVTKMAKRTLMAVVLLPSLAHKWLYGPFS